MMHFKNALLYTESFCFQKGGFSVENGRFCEVLQEHPEAVDLQGALVIPGLIDVHTHGNSGADFSDGEGVEKMAAYLGKNGITSFAPATMTLPYEVIARALAAGAAFRKKQPEGVARLLGVQMEGPFFSEKKKGAQNGEYLRKPDYAAFKRLYDDCGGLIRIVDIAPELEGAEDFVRRAKDDCTVSIAHTDSPYEQARAAIAAGVTHLTHLYNAMPPIHHRKPGVIGAAAEDERVSAELICDGIHVHPSSVRLAFRLFGAERICLISDALRCCGMPDGAYMLGGQEVFLKDNVAKLADGTIAGAATNLYSGLQNAIAFGIAPEAAVRAATYNPARAIGALSEVGSIADGKLADFILCDSDFHRKAVYIGGKPV